MIFERTRLSRKKSHNFAWSCAISNIFYCAMLCRQIWIKFMPKITWFRLLSGHYNQMMKFQSSSTNIENKVWNECNLEILSVCPTGKVKEGLARLGTLFISSIFSSITNLQNGRFNKHISLFSTWLYNIKDFNKVTICLFYAWRKVDERPTKI